MPPTSSASDVFGLGTLVLIIVCCCTGASCLALVAFLHFKVGKQQPHHLHDFEAPWIVRMVLAGLCMLWSLGELARLSWLRESGRVLHNAGLSTQTNLCRFYVVWSVGVIEPGFLLTVLFLFRGSVQVAASAARNLNSGVLTLMPLFCAPVFILQLILALTGNERGFGGTIPPYLSSVYEMGIDSGETFCNFPLFSIVLLGLFLVAFIIYFTVLGIKMIKHVINRRLQLRVYLLLVVLMILLPLHVVLLGLSVRVSSSKAAHEVLVFLGFLALLLCMGGAMGVLVVLPSMDTLEVYHLYFRRREMAMQADGSSTVEMFGAPLSDSEDSLHDASVSLLGAGSVSTGNEVGSSRRDSSLILDVVSKDLTLGPGSWLADLPGSLGHHSSSSRNILAIL